MLQSAYRPDHEFIIAKSLRGFLAEMRMIDVEHLISFATLRMHGHIADLVSSAAENYFSPGFVTFGQHCEAAVDWSATPVITFDLVMNLGWAQAYLSATMKQEEAEVRLVYFAVAKSVSGAECSNARLTQTISRNSYSA